MEICQIIYNLLYQIQNIYYITFYFYVHYIVENNVIVTL